MELADFIGVIRKWKWLILPVIVVVTGYTYITGASAQKIYTAKASVAVGLSQITSASAVGISLAQSSDKIGATYAQLVTAQPVLKAALDKSGVKWSEERLGSATTVTPITDTTMLEIGVNDSDPQQAQLLANSVADAFVSYIQSVSDSGAQQAESQALKQLSDVEQKLQKQNTTTQVDEVLVKGLQEQRDSILKEYGTLLDQQVNAGDVSVVNRADSAAVIGTSLTQRTGIGFVISLVGGIMLAFTAEAGRKSLKAADGKLEQNNEPVQGSSRNL